MPLLDQIKPKLQLVSFLHLEYSHESMSARGLHLSLISNISTCSLKNIARMHFFLKVHLHTTCLNKDGLTLFEGFSSNTAFIF